MKARKVITYRRSWDLRWYRNGILIASPPERILIQAQNMAIECSITEYRKR